MGIDIYAKWKGQTKKEEKAQFTGFDTTKGNVGYLREAYHGDPYATRYLVAEAFENGDVKIRADVLRSRLPKTLELVAERQEKVYPTEKGKWTKAVQKSFTDFVELCEKKELETGEPCTISAFY